MRFEFLFLGKTKESYLAAAIDDYARRLRHYVTVDIKILKDRKAGKGVNPEVFKKQEAAILQAGRSANSYLVALDRLGTEVDSERLAALVRKWEFSGDRCVSFILGGPFGLDGSLVKKADVVLSLSQMTFTHELSRLLLLEQLYRAYSINRGGKYHR